jgi:hypothetical protein
MSKWVPRAATLKGLAKKDDHCPKCFEPYTDALVRYNHTRGDSRGCIYELSKKVFVLRNEIDLMRMISAVIIDHADQPLWKRALGRVKLDTKVVNMLRAIRTSKSHEVPQGDEPSSGV